MHQHYRSIGGWTFAFNDYYDLNITKYSDSTELYALQMIDDPLRKQKFKYHI